MFKSRLESKKSYKKYMKSYCSKKILYSLMSGLIVNYALGNRVTVALTWTSLVFVLVKEC